MENQKNHKRQINRINRGILGYAMCDITDKPIQYTISKNVLILYKREEYYN